MAIWQGSKWRGSHSKFSMFNRYTTTLQGYSSLDDCQTPPLALFQSILKILVALAVSTRGDTSCAMPSRSPRFTDNSSLALTLAVQKISNNIIRFVAEQESLLFVNKLQPIPTVKHVGKQMCRHVAACGSSMVVVVLLDMFYCKYCQRNFTLA
jgi:hypothetical protein